MAPQPSFEPAQLLPLQRLTSGHVAGDFDSGSPSLDGWLRHAARRNGEGAVRAYVVCRDTRVVAFYSLAIGAVFQAGGSGRNRRNPPEPIPVMVLGRLAVDRRCQGQGLGRTLLRDAVLRTLQAADIAGVRAILVHAKDAPARDFYERCGFLRSPIDPLTLLLPLLAARAALEGP